MSENNKKYQQEWSFLSFTDGHWRSLFWLGEELYTINKLGHRTQGHQVCI